MTFAFFVFSKQAFAATTSLIKTLYASVASRRSGRVRLLRRRLWILKSTFGVPQRSRI
jgi:hypothetical protein